MELHPASFQMSVEKINVKNNLGLEKNATLEPPAASMMLLIAPSLFKSNKNNDETTTQDKKCGKVTTICTNFLKNLILISLINSAVVTAAKNEITTLMEPMITVFLNASQNPGVSKMTLKLSKPIQLLVIDSNKPNLGEYLAKESNTPYIGM